MSDFVRQLLNFLIDFLDVEKAVFGFLGGLVVTAWQNRKYRRPASAARRRLLGRRVWRGTWIQSQPESHPSRELVLRFGVRARKLVGEMRLTAPTREDDGPLRYYHYFFDGGFKDSRWIWLRYNHVAPERVEYGSVLIHLHSNPEEMPSSGSLSGYGSTSETSVFGPIELAPAEQVRAWDHWVVRMTGRAWWRRAAGPEPESSSASPSAPSSG